MTDPEGLVFAKRLSNVERAEAEQTARRLYGELKACISLLPETERGGSALSRALGLDRATCQRLVAATSRPDAGVETLVQLPGVLGLRQFIAAMASRTEAGDAAEQIAAAAAAVDRFEVLIGELGGSQRKLRARLAVERAGAQGGFVAARGANDDASVREALFRAGAAVTGRWSETSVSISIIRPTPGSTQEGLKPGPNATTQTVKLRGVIGHHARADAVPLEVGYTAPLQADNSDEPARHRAPSTLLEEYCSRPLPRLVSHTAGQRMIYVIDAAEPGEIENADIVLADCEPRVDQHPASMDPPMGEVWGLVNFPSRRYIFDVYLHREIACRCLPSLELHLWTPNIVQHTSSRWSTRFPGGPRLQLLGAGLRDAATSAYDRHAELTAHLFDRFGWDPEPFIGYRCEVAFPVWRGGYCMAFDFSVSTDAK